MHSQCGVPETLEDAEKVQDRRPALGKQVLLPLCPFIHTRFLFHYFLGFFWVNGFILQLSRNLRNSY